MTSEPQTESGRALEEVFGNAKWIRAIEQEAASKAVAEVLDRLDRRIGKLCEGYVSTDRQMGYDVVRGLIKHEHRR